MEKNKRWVGEFNKKIEILIEHTQPLDLSSLHKWIEEAGKEFPSYDQAVKAFGKNSPNPDCMLKHARDTWFFKWFGQSEEDASCYPF